MNSQRLTLPERGQLSMSYFPCTTNKTQQNSIEVEIETKKSHKKHFETKVKELQDTIRKAEREHENMKKLVRVRMSLIRLHIPELGHVGHMNSFFFLSVAVIYITSVCYLRKTVLWCGSSKASSTVRAIVFWSWTRQLIFTMLSYSWEELHLFDIDQFANVLGHCPNIS